MSRNTFITLFIGIIVLGAVAVGAYFYFFTDLFSKYSGENTDGTNSTSGFSLFGNFGSSNTKNNNNNDSNDDKPKNNQSQFGEEPEQRLIKLVQNPVAGFIQSALGSTTVVRYMEKETGHTFDIDMSIPTARMKVSITTVPRIYQALFGQVGSTVLLRYLDSDNSIQTYSARIARATTTSALQNGVEMKGLFLPENIGDISVSPDGTRIFTLTTNGNTEIGTASDFDGSKKSQIFDSPFTEWLSSWTGDKSILLTTKPSSVVTGYAYTLDVRSGSFQKIYGGTYGLTALLSPDGKRLLVSEITDGLPSLKVYAIQSGNLNNIGLRTIADKCVWATNTAVYCAVPKTTPQTESGYPDAWYQGLVSFADTIWLIDTDILNTEIKEDISETARVPIDAINLSVDKNGNYLYFINKSDSSLWALKLAQ